MKIVISVASDDLSGLVNSTFGRCQGFIIAEVEGKEIKSHSFETNPAMNSPGGAGIAAAQFVVSSKAEAIISGNLGPNAFNVLKQAGIKFYSANGLSINEAITKLAEGTLEEKTGASVSPNFGTNAGTGNNLYTGGK